MWWKESVKTLPGVGMKRALELESLGIYTIGDLLYFYPRQGAYLDYSQVKNLRELTVDGSKQIFKARIVRINSVHQGRKPFVSITVGDETGYADIYLFANQRYLVRKFKPDDEVLVIGRVKMGYVTKLVTPELMQHLEEDAKAPGILPVYSLAGGLTQNFLRKLMKTALEMAQKDLPESLPQWLLTRLHPMGRLEALKNIHFPENKIKLQRARERFVFEELFLLQCGLLYYRNDALSGSALNLGQNGAMVALVLSHLPYRLTPAQEKAWQEITSDLESIKPMHRILQGDVGSGKTAVAALALAKAAESGYQAAIMAPTEILARQHYLTLSEQLKPAGIKVGLLVGGMKRRPKSKVQDAKLNEQLELLRQERPWHRDEGDVFETREDVLEALASGYMQVVVGTHALLQDDVVFKDLALVITDEQHRFGVEQRAKLSAKSGQGVHTLVMTATPIPRTLALTVYGDLDISRMEGLPPGRKKVRTLLYGQTDRLAVYKGVRHQAELGHQVYVVCPLVEDSENIDAKSVEQVYEEMRNTVLAGVSTALIHGRMRPLEKEAIMADFVAGKVSVLFSTTVIEVGVNVPNATLIVVENAERFGLAQLHQLRGRVGRGEEQSFCALVMDTEDAESKARLEVLVASDDGFYLAEQDLRMRGAGQLFGLRQHGLPDLHIADILRDTETIVQARRLAQECVNNGGKEEIQRLVEMQLDERFAGIFNL